MLFDQYHSRKEDFAFKFLKIREFKKKMSREVKRKPEKRSKFHNLSRLFMYNVISMYSAQNMKMISIPDFFQDSIKKIIIKIKANAKK